MASCVFRIAFRNEPTTKYTARQNILMSAHPVTPIFCLEEIFAHIVCYCNQILYPPFLCEREHLNMRLAYRAWIATGVYIGGMRV